MTITIRNSTDLPQPTKFQVGTEGGHVLMGNRRAKTATDKISYAYPAHVGPVYGLQKNPFFPKIFLTVGAWNAKVCRTQPQFDLKSSSIDA